MIAARRNDPARPPDGPERLSSNGSATAHGPAPLPDGQVTIVPANKASWADVEAVFGTADYCGRCRCQALKVVPWIWRDSTLDQRIDGAARADRLR